MTLEFLEALFITNSKRDEDKLPFLYELDVKLKILQTFVRIFNDVHAIEAKDYLLMSAALEELGRMLGGWIRSLKPEKENLAD
jgi:hypothetical protein